MKQLTKDTRLVLCYPVEGRHIDQIRDAAGPCQIIDAGQEGIADEILTADLFCGHAKVPVPWDDVVRQGRLRWIHSSAAGMDHCLVPSVIQSDIVVTSSSGVFAPQVAEQTLTLLLGLVRQLPIFFRAQQAKEFERRPTDDLKGKTVGIVGFGGNGQRIAQVLAPFDVRIVATDLFPMACPKGVDAIWPARELHRLLAKSDVVVLCIPLNSETHHLLDAAAIKAMKKQAYLINVARGPVVDEQALATALKSGKIRAAGLDVTEVEPLPQSSPLWNLPNVLITPHVGAQAASRVDDATRLFCWNLRRYRERRPLINLVDKHLGFPLPEHRVKSLSDLWTDSPENSKMGPKSTSHDGRRMTTTLHDIHATIPFRNRSASSQPNELVKQYRTAVESKRLSWTTHQRLIRMLGAGGQGVVYLSERRGADNFTLPVAVKVFSPERFDTVSAYEDAMERIAVIAARVAQIQQDNLIDVQNFVDRRRIRMMVMEWVDGYDLRQLLDNEMVEKVRHRVSGRRWEYITRVVISPGPVQPRITPGVAVAIVRDCLVALAALHRDGIVHGDIKPANIMLKYTGNAKIVDIGSAYDYEDPPPQRTCTPKYAAPEVLEGADSTPRSDLASLGYVLIEMLSGAPIFGTLTSYKDLLEAKRTLAKKLHEVLPSEVTCNELLMSFCRGLIATDPAVRFPSAEMADLGEVSAATFHRQLVKTDLSVEYDNEIRLWLEELRELKESHGEESA